MISSSNETENAVVANLAELAAKPEELEPGKIYVLAGHDGGQRVMDTDAYAEQPRRPRAREVGVTDFASFAAYLGKYGEEGETEVMADEVTARISADIDGDNPALGQNGRYDHSVTLNLVHSKEWAAWVNIDGRLMGQEEFAEFIELHALEIVTPNPAEVLEIAQSLQVKRGVSFESATRLADGNVQLGYREETSATAGAAGQLSIPTELHLALAPFHGGEPYKVRAAFRYRLTGGQLKLGIKLLNADQARKEAWDEIAQQVLAYTVEHGYLHLNG